MEIKRYDVFDDGIDVFKFPTENGEFVLFEDYSHDRELLQEEVGRLLDIVENREARIKVLEETNKEWIRQKGPGGWIDNLRNENAHMKDALQEITYHLYDEQDYARVREMGRAALAKEPS